MKTGCRLCNKNGLCNRHKLEYLKWVAESAQNAYLEELKTQSRKKPKQEREQNAKCK